MLVMDAVRSFAEEFEHVLERLKGLVSNTRYQAKPVCEYEHSERWIVNFYDEFDDID